MQSNVNSRSGRSSVVSIEIEERIKRRSWVRIQQRIPQPGLADFADGQILPFVPGIAKSRFPVPTLEIIAKFSHLSSQPDVKQRIPVGEFFMSGTSVVNAAKPNACSDRETGAVRKEIWNRRIGDCEGIPCVHDWDTAAPGTKAPPEWIGRRRHSRRGRVEK